MQSLDSSALNWQPSHGVSIKAKEQPPATTPQIASSEPVQNQADQMPPEQNQQNAAPIPDNIRENQNRANQIAQDGGDREDDWLGLLHNVCSFLVLFSIIYYYSTLERFLVIFTIVMLLVMYAISNL
jgi:hypothetical protein